MKYIIIFCTLVVFATACSPSKTDTTETKKVPTLAIRWQTDTLLTTCESVVYDKDRDVLYVANINGKPDGKDGNGFISILAMDGKVSSPKWITGMDAPKGMGIFAGKLYAADIDKIHEIDIASGKIAQTYPIPDAKFLNDVTVDISGKVYASDSNTGDIFMLDNGAVSKWYSGIAGPNGLLAEGERMLMLSWNDKTMNSIGNEGKQIVMLADSLENPDGIEAVGDGGYLVSSWNGVIHYVDATGKITDLLDTRADSLSAADIEYIPEKHLLLIPTFFKNKVTAYELTN